jgi:hypothetical protein
VLPTRGVQRDAHDKSPVSGDGARGYGVVQDNLCLSELEAVWCVGDKESVYGMKGNGVNRTRNTITWTVLIPLHQAGQLGGEHRGACAPT